MSSSNKTEIILDNPYTFFTWFAKIQGLVPRDLWRFFDPDQQDESEEPVQTTIRQLRDGATTLQELSATDKTIFTQLRTIYTQELTQYHRLLSKESKLREQILNSVADSKKS